MEQAAANEARRVARNSVLLGRVIAIDVSDAENPVCRVAIGDDESDGQGLQSGWLRWTTARAGSLRTWSAPTLGEQVKIDCPMGDLAQGIVSGALYSEDRPAPSTSIAESVMQFDDGARISYDEEWHALTVDLPAGATIRMVAPASVVVETKDATVKAETITLDATQTTCKGKLTVEGPFVFLSGADGQAGEGGSGPVMRINGPAEFAGVVTAADHHAGGISLIHHPHQAKGEFAITSPALSAGA
ncbi:bacteriophage baseplate assembly protein V [Burkholderia lata]|uniref:Bacteriophage baseplate assembly protein V n=1 Tax=Burkholderia lata (strain ATCC 17760 / DSM 23089 / LMG 22485 / NCIMB 9086 / R18194 / 383) TaxID=482957 RepID=A0A6P2XVL4_BURL3|nr:bacteriophage baseplate assembly protein V [Burkholderia lata]